MLKYKTACLDVFSGRRAASEGAGRAWGTWLLVVHSQKNRTPSNHITTHPTYQLHLSVAVHTYFLVFTNHH